MVGISLNRELSNLSRLIRLAPLSWRREWSSWEMLQPGEITLYPLLMFYYHHHLSLDNGILKLWSRSLSNQSGDGGDTRGSGRHGERTTHPQPSSWLGLLALYVCGPTFISSGLGLPALWIHFKHGSAFIVCRLYKEYMKKNQRLRFICIDLYLSYPVQLTSPPQSLTGMSWLNLLVKQDWNILPQKIRRLLQKWFGLMSPTIRILPSIEDHKAEY